MFHEAQASVSASTSTTVSRARTGESSPIENANNRSAPSNEPARSCTARSVARINITTTLADHAFSTVPSALASLTKGGLNSVTKSLATEYAARNIRVNAVAPGVIRTPMHPEETHEFLAALHPVGRLGEIEEIVDAVTYLENAKFVTGEVLHVDGGQQAGH
jgi:NAD(P)-dependent dehydrogenase (short-subunit alcohol dehydrogenase family)